MVQMSLFLQDVHDIDKIFHFKHILILQITSRLITRVPSFLRIKLLQKRSKLTKKAQKSEESEFAISRKKALVAKLNKTESSPLTLFSQMFPS